MWLTRAKAIFVLAFAFAFAFSYFQRLDTSTTKIARECPQTRWSSKKCHTKAHAEKHP
jgi:hypothetical protein